MAGEMSSKTRTRENASGALPLADISATRVSPRTGKERRR